jgi:hypothetical protein
MKALLTALPLAIASLAPLPGYCSNELTAHVKSFGTYGNGNIWIVLDSAIDELGCSGPYMEFPANGPANKAVLATTAFSIATGASIVVKTDGCFNSAAATLTGARTGYFGVNKL